MRKLTQIFMCLILCASSVLLCAAAGQVPEAVLNNTKSVVRIRCLFPDSTAYGSGFCINSNSGETLIVTNQHVVKGNPYAISVWVDAYEPISGEILAESAQKDLCILRLVQPVIMDPLTLGKNPVQQGDAVYAVGFPSAADNLSDTEIHLGKNATITDGIVSAVHSFSVSGKGSPIRLLQINADINPGNSGGPLFNSRGEVVGINTYGIQDSQGIFGAIDISELRSFLEENNLNIDTHNNIVEVCLLALSIAAAAFVMILLIYTGKRKRRPLSRKQASCLAAAGLFILLVSGYFLSYGIACGNLSAGKTREAEKWLFAPGITRLHDAKMIQYLNACEMMDARRYEKAEAGFQRLSGYRDADTMALEAAYLHAAQMTDSGKYEEAKKVYTRLAEVSYKDSEEKLLDTDFQKALFTLYEEKNYALASELLSSREYNNRAGIEELRAQVSGQLYNQAQSLYRSGDYAGAEKLFKQLEPMQESDRYLKLIKAHSPDNALVSLVPMQDMIDMFEFEDTREVVVQYERMAVDFLRGYWKANTGKKYFRISEDDSAAFNLPYNPNGANYTISNGVFLQYAEGDPASAKAIFTITPQSPDCIKIYCHKDGKNYTLYRQ